MILFQILFEALDLGMISSVDEVKNREFRGKYL